jgi:lipoprotein-releasing system permease protein
MASEGQLGAIGSGTAGSGTAGPNAADSGKRELDAGLAPSVGATGSGFEVTPGFSDDREVKGGTGSSTLRIASAVLLVVLLVTAILWALRRIARSVGGRMQRVWVVLTAVCILLAAGLGAWAAALPEPKRANFELAHQVVRVGAALSGTLAMICVLALALPWALNRLEGSGFSGLVAARHVRATKSGFLTVISILSIAGVALSSLTLCAVVSIMGGFGADLKSKILGNNAHVSVDSIGGDGSALSNALDGMPWDTLLDKVRITAGVSAATPIVTGEAMASSQSNTAGVLVRGVDPESIGQVIDLVRNIEVGRFEYLSEPERLKSLPADEPIWIGRGGHTYLKGPSTTSHDFDELDPDVQAAVHPRAFPGVILGRELAKTLHVYVGDEITLVSAVGDLGPMGIMPRARRFAVAAVFYSGMYEYDSSHAYMTLAAAQEFLDQPGQVSQIDVRVERQDQAPEVRQRLTQALTPFSTEGEASTLRVRDWQEMNKGLFSALQLEKVVTFVILSIAIVVGSFCIICTLLLMVTEKSKEIAILKATGASDWGILRIFMSEGLLIGGIGTVFGVVTGVVLCLGLLWFGVRLDPDVYYVDRLPIHVDPIDYAIVTIASLGITLAATLYPALAASRLRPVDGIRYE